MSTKPKCSRLFSRLTGKTLRILVIRAGFPYHKAPHLYPWLVVFILLPFLEEDSLHELIESHDKKLTTLYRLLRQYPESFERFLHLLTIPLLFDLLDEFDAANDTTKSRQRLRLVIDDTKSEKFGEMMEFLHKLFDHAKDRYIMGYNDVLILVVSGSMAFPFSFILWLPHDHPEHRSKNDIARDEIETLKTACDRRGYHLDEVELLFERAYHVQKVMKAANAAGFRVISKASSIHKFEFEGARLTPKKIIETVKERDWKYLDAATWYHRISARHHTYGDVVFIVRRRQLKNKKLIYDVLICNTLFYNAVRIHKSYKARWEIEMHFKYYKQYLRLGKTQFGKVGSIRSQLACVAIAGLLVALFRCQRSRTISFRQAIKLLAQELRS